MIAFIAIGANLGDAMANVDDAFAHLDRLPGTRVLAQSSRYRTAPIDSSGDDSVLLVEWPDHAGPAVLRRALGRRLP